MKYDITYKEISEAFLGRVRMDNPQTGEEAANWLCEFDESKLAEAERLNAILPVLKWCAEKNVLTDWLEDELYLYYESYLKGELDGILADYEKDEVIHDLKEAYIKVFGTEELVP